MAINKYMKKNPIILFTAFTVTTFLYSCAGESNQNQSKAADSLLISVSSDTTIHAEISAEEEGSEEIEITYTDTTILVKGNYTITQIAYNDGERDGIENRIINNKTKKSYTIGGGIIETSENFLIIGNDGSETTNEQNLTIAKIEDGTTLFNLEYKDSYKIEKNNLKLWVVVAKENVKDLNKLPNCEKEMKDTPQNIGFAEEQIVNLKTGELIHSGKYKCVFVE